MTSSAPVQEVAEPPAPQSPPRLKRRLYPLLATLGLIIVGMSSTLWWGPRLAGLTAWALPHDLWGTMIAASRLLHGQLGDLYTQPTGLITLPGGALILVPLVAVTDLIGLPMHIPGHNADPVSWLYAGPYETAISAIALFAADAIAEHLGLTRRRRLLLAAAGAMLLWNVTIRWGHPEDAVAVGLLLYAVLELAKARQPSKPGRSAWLFGLAVAVQPLVLLSLPVVLAVIRPNRVAGYLTRAALPGAALLGAAALANWHATYVAVTSQPNWPTVNHPTPWLALATPLPNGAVAAGPSRIVAIVVACACAVLVWRQCRVARAPQPWDNQTLLQVLWWVAVALAVRSAFEPVMVAYYVWPSLTIALVTSAATLPGLLMTSAVAGTLTFASQSTSHSPWIWWAPLFVGLCLTLYLARVRHRAEPQPVLVTAPG
ncbi:MAG TPA: hypothetical protein VFI65_17385 [Streptosporangiaceae bacterium]|nr:hypothetical protein [Streptosporangiaceae bacterium]